MLRRHLLFVAAAPLLAQSKLTPKQRIDRVLNGQDVDRPPFSLWHHFGLENDGPEKHASATLAFHRDYGTDLVKVMSDFPYPKPQGNWWELRALPDPFTAQLRALTIISREIGNRAYFVETIFNPWNVAEKLSSPEAVRAMAKENPARLHAALDAIARSEANHARAARKLGAAGIFLAIANSSTPEYATFSEPYDRIVLDAVATAPLNILHLHGADIPFDRFIKGWKAAAINYSARTTGTPIAGFRRRYSGIIMGGIDEVDYRTLSVDELKKQATQSRQTAGPRFILAPGCSVPNEATPPELRKLREAVAHSG
jgi:uroporphyrinogen decarboxylase